jgi:hypothetical protein
MILSTLPKHSTNNSRIFNLLTKRINVDPSLNSNLFKLLENYALSHQDLETISNSSEICESIFTFLLNCKQFIPFERIVLLLMVLIQFSSKKQIFNDNFKILESNISLDSFPSFFDSNINFLELLFKFYVRIISKFTIRKIINGMRMKSICSTFSILFFRFLFFGFRLKIKKYCRM